MISFGEHLRKAVARVQSLWQSLKDRWNAHAELQKLRSELTDTTPGRLLADLDALRAENTKVKADFEEAAQILQADRDKVQNSLREASEIIETLRGQILAMKSKIDPSAACPSCGVHQVHPLAFMSSLTWPDGRKGAVLHYCTQCKATWPEHCVVDPRGWAIELPADVEFPAKEEAGEAKG